MQGKGRDASGLPVWAYVCAILLLPLTASVFYLDRWSPVNVAATLALSGAGALILLGIHDARRFWWAWRAIGIAIFAGCAGYAADRLMANTLSMGNYLASLLTAGGALLIVGLPGLKAALARDLDTFLGARSPRSRTIAPTPPTDNVAPLPDTLDPAQAPATHPGNEQQPAA